MRRHELSDEERAFIRPLLPNKPRGAPQVADRRALNAILWRFRTGAPWRVIPERCGPRTTLCNRFARLRAAGVWDRILAAASEAYDGDIVVIDSSCVRVHQHGAAVKKDGPAAGDGCTGRSRGELTTKIHVLVDAEGRAVNLMLRPGQEGDAPAAARLLKDLAPGAMLIADRAYDTNAICDIVAERGAWANIPPCSIRNSSFAFFSLVYRQRILVKLVFNRTKQFGVLATR